MKTMYKGKVFESAEVIEEGFFNKPAKPGYAKTSNKIGKTAVFFYVEDLGNDGFVLPEMQNPILIDYLKYCPDQAFAIKLKDAYIRANSLGPDNKVNVIKHTKEIVG